MSVINFLRYIWLSCPVRLHSSFGASSVEIYRVDRHPPPRQGIFKNISRRGVTIIFHLANFYDDVMLPFRIRYLTISCLLMLNLPRVVPRVIWTCPCVAVGYLPPGDCVLWGVRTNCTYVTEFSTKSAQAASSQERLFPVVCSHRADTPTSPPPPLSTWATFNPSGLGHPEMYSGLSGHLQ